MRKLPGWTSLALIAAVTACSSGKPQSQPSHAPQVTPSSAAPSASSVAYHPLIDPMKFSSVVTNPYFPLRPGQTLIYDGIRDGKPQHTEMKVTSETRVIMGVRCVVVRDDVTSNGALVEKTTDWYAQASDGAVWYFGEATAEYVNGAISNTQGSWEGGVDGAQPGIIMEAAPKVGDNYKQEFRPGIAEDTAKILTTSGTAKVRAKTYTRVVATEDTNPLAPDKRDTKQYAPGIGLVYTIKESTGHHEVSSYTGTRVG